MCIAAWIVPPQGNLPVEGRVSMEDVMPNGGDVAPITGWVVAFDVYFLEVDHVCVGGAVLVPGHVPVRLMPVPLFGRVDIKKLPSATHVGSQEGSSQQKALPATKSWTVEGV